MGDGAKTPNMRCAVIFVRSWLFGEWSAETFPLILIYSKAHILNKICDKVGETSAGFDCLHFDFERCNLHCLEVIGSDVDRV